MWPNRALAHLTDAPRWRRFLTFALLGAVAAMGQAPFSWPLLSLLGFVGACLCLAQTAKARSATLLGWAFGLGYFVTTLHWLVSPFLVEPERHGWMAPFAVGFMAAGLALFWAAAFALAKRFGWAALALTLPLAELARAYVFTGFPWGMPAYGLIDTQFAQAAAYVGVHGVNLLFTVLAVAIAGAIFGTLSASNGDRGWLRLLALMGAAIGLAGFLPGPAPSDAPAEAARVRLVQPNAPQHLKWRLGYMPVFFDRALGFTAAAPEGPAADLIIWPETSLPASLPNADRALGALHAAAAGTPVLFGANRYQGFRLFNTAALMGADGQIAAQYDKQHLVPFGEYFPFGDHLARFGIYGLAASEGRGFSAGQGSGVMDLGPLGLARMLICYEAVFPQDVRRYDSRPAVLVQITNDAWFGAFSGPYQHLVQAQMRAIEQGLPLIRAANTGVSAMIDARGRITAALGLNTAGYLDAALPPKRAMTLYARTGDWLIFALLLGALLLCAARKARFND
ncbi:apolipoprotein N-acyltransferase [Cognatishimia sp. SS12]|uniref:apolipoprotein N-acyltransferase n=1 Tax=Cognatishimia sp. SS12 TaxID=2979465 RepID=UPI00232CE0F4|nr:apolipoprotein N-acyltransferase [Cognatishimia sp. SS12]MDC0738747.1 apolipoprotein N-acyltransferase [Cognatishimia sp. SS12]